MARMKTKIHDAICEKQIRPVIIIHHEKRIQNNNNNKVNMKENTYLDDDTFNIFNKSSSGIHGVHYEKQGSPNADGDVERRIYMYIYICVRVYIYRERE